MGMIFDDFHWEMMSGTTRTFRVTVTDPDTGLPVDISLATFWATFKRQITDADADAVFQLTSTAGDFTIIDGPNGILEATIDDAKTTALVQPVKLLVDVKMEDAGGEPSSLGTGTLLVRVSVTRATV